MSITPPDSAKSPFAAELRAWLILAVGALALAGFLAALLAASRMPGIAERLPLQFFRVALVTHVIFSFVVWYLVMLGAYCTWALGRMPHMNDGRMPHMNDGRMPPSGNDQLHKIGRIAVGGVALSLLLMLIPALFGLGEPSLNDYVPMVDHPLFQGGLLMLLAAVALPVVRLLLALRRGADGVCWGIAAAGIAYLAALLCFILGWLQRPPIATGTEAFYQAIFWGGGHVLQFVHTALILVIWWVLAQQLHGRPPASLRVLAGLCLSVAAIALLAPGLYALWDANDAALPHAFTQLYKIGLLVQPMIGMVFVAIALLRRGPALGSVIGAALVLSWLLFAVGGLMGYSLTSSDTRTPAHYHAMIGAVTLAHMAMLCTILLPSLGRPLAPSRWTGRWARAMVWCYALGQLIHSSGLYVAGTYGIARKTAGNAQGLDGIAQKGAMVIMGLGGGIAVIGGIIFIVLALRTLLRRVSGAAP
jgi:hypothetical protein